MWDLPGPGLEPMSPALAGGFLTTAPPGKPYFIFIRDAWERKKEMRWSITCKDVHDSPLMVCGRETVLIYGMLLAECT